MNLCLMTVALLWKAFAKKIRNGCNESPVMSAGLQSKLCVIEWRCIVGYSISTCAQAIDIACHICQKNKKFNLRVT